MLQEFSFFKLAVSHSNVQWVKIAGQYWQLIPIGDLIRGSEPQVEKTLPLDIWSNASNEQPKLSVFASVTLCWAKCQAGKRWRVSQGRCVLLQVTWPAGASGKKNKKLSTGLEVRCLWGSYGMSVCVCPTSMHTHTQAAIAWCPLTLAQFPLVTRRLLLMLPHDSKIENFVTVTRHDTEILYLEHCLESHTYR